MRGVYYPCVSIRTTHIERTHTYPNVSQRITTYRTPSRIVRAAFSRSTFYTHWSASLTAYRLSCLRVGQRPVISKPIRLTPRTDENACKTNQNARKMNLLRISTPQKMALDPVLKALKGLES